MAKTMYCFCCNKNVKPMCKLENNSYEVRNQKVCVHEIVFYCPFCNNELFDESLDTSLYNIYNEYLKKYDLSFAKFKEIRESYNLSQKLFAKTLGWSKRDIARYENASLLPSKEHLLIYKYLCKDRRL